MNIHVAVLPYLRSSSGAMAYTLELAKGLAKKGLYVSLVGFEVDPSHKNDLEKSKVRVYELPALSRIFEYFGGPVFYYLGMSKSIVRALKEIDLERKVDLVHFTLAPALIGTNITKPVVTSAWNPLSPFDNIRKRILSLQFPYNFVGIPYSISYDLLDTYAYKRVHAITCSTLDVLSRVRLLGGENAYLCSPPIDDALFNSGGSKFLNLPELPPMKYKDVFSRVSESSFFNAFR